MGKLAPIALLLLGLAGGFAGVYFAMPAIRPAYVDALNSRLDSLRALADTTGLNASMPDAAVVDSAIVMLDSLNRLRSHIAQLEQESARIAASRERLAGRLDSLSVAGGEAAELASTLSILEDNELADVVAAIDDKVLRSLYVTASRKNKARLLQAMPPERAGHLIRALFDGASKESN